MRQRTDRGEVATYIPELARVDPKAFGLVVIDAEGNVAAGGDSDTPFSIQSISKVFTLTLALGQDRRPAVAARRPRAFGQPLQLDRPAGVRARQAAQSLHQCRRHCRHRRDPLRTRAARGAGRDPAVHAVSRRRSLDHDRRGGGGLGAAHRLSQRALANYMKSFGVLENPVDLTLGVYFHHCAIAMSCRQLAMAGRFLAQFGRNPIDGPVGGPARARTPHQRGDADLRPLRRLG